MSAYRERSMHAWTEDSIRLVATPSAFAKSTLFYIQEIGHFYTLKSYYTEREQLDSYLVVYTLSGKGKLTYRGKTYSLLPNQVFFIDCMEYQHYKTDQNEPWELVWVHLNGSSTRGYYEEYAASSDPVLTLSPETNIPSLFRQLIHNQQNKSIRSELIGSKLLVELLTELLLASQHIELIDVQMPSFITGVAQKLDQQFQESITLDQLAHQFSISKYHLAKEFKKYTGFSPNEYLINTRITHAKEILKYSNLPVADIAAQVGIDNVSHFINLFKNRVEHTPLAYRKKWQIPT
jgi:YesN/AraC family two-component response regulator